MLVLYFLHVALPTVLLGATVASHEATISLSTKHKMTKFYVRSAKLVFRNSCSLWVVTSARFLTISSLFQNLKTQYVLEYGVSLPSSMVGVASAQPRLMTAATLCMYKFSDNFLPSTFQSYFTSVINIHQYHTWSHNFYAPFTRSSFSMTTLRFYGPRLWNALDPLIKSQILCRLIKKSPY